MKVVDKHEATRTLGDYASEIQGGAVIVTDHGQPVAALVPIENADLETVSLSTNRHFLDLIERSRSRVKDEGGVSGDEMRRRFEQAENGHDVTELGEHHPK
jgi:antitoxin (DNA-binding transcriptional repressor) of toxin-antitoxin stability system